MASNTHFVQMILIVILRKVVCAAFIGVSVFRTDRVLTLPSSDYDHTPITVPYLSLWVGHQPCGKYGMCYAFPPPFGLVPVCLLSLRASGHVSFGQPCCSWAGLDVTGLGRWWGGGHKIKRVHPPLAPTRGIAYVMFL